MSELLQGKIASLQITKPPAKDEKTGKTTGKWITYELAFTDGTTSKVIHAVEAQDKTPNRALQVGDVIECKKGSFGGWVTSRVSWDGEQSPSGEKTTERPHREEGEKKTYTPAKSSGNDRDNYWQNKAVYEETIRDKKIERQTYIRMAVDSYNAGLPHLTEPPLTPEEINAYFEQAVDLGESVYQAMSKK